METVLHLHIPRTAGIAIRKTLFPVLVRDGRCHHYKNEDDLHSVVETGEHIALVSGHFSWGMHERAEFKKNSVYFISLREPVERVLSVYSYIRSRPNHFQHQEFSKKTLLQLVREPDAVLTHLSDRQVRQLVYHKSERRRMERDDMERAWERLQRSDVIVTFPDLLNDGLRKLGDRIGRVIPPVTSMVNTAPSDLGSSEADPTVAAVNEWDAELYRRARDRFG